MKIRYIEEPNLQFGTDFHICPRSGIYSYNPYDYLQVRPEKINLGIVGKSESIEEILKWLESCKSYIAGKTSQNPHSNLFLNFCGFNKEIGFKSEITYDDSYIRKINNSDINQIIKRNLSFETRIIQIAELYINEIKYLSKNKYPNVILCVLSEQFMTSILTDDRDNIKESEEDNQLEAEELDEILERENNFRRYLKAKAMQYHVPIQIVRDRISKPSSAMQDPATIAWNFFTALYYKASGTPWALIRKDRAESTCYAGISFYKSRDKKMTQTSIAQIFNELGKGVILRGEEIMISKNDPIPHMNEEQSFKLIDLSLQEYYEAIKIYPKRLVVHKTSNFSFEEIKGFKMAASKSNINQLDLITILSSNFRLYRAGQYPPLRGTHLTLTDTLHILYTRGSVPYYETYTGMYIPSPLEVRLFEYDESPNVICDEILALTKMNWNNTQFDRKYPITLECARNVGQILKYLEPNESMELKYCFYM